MSSSRKAQPCANRSILMGFLPLDPSLHYSIIPLFPGPDLANRLSVCTYEVCAPGPDLVWPVIPDNMKHAPGRAGQANCGAKF